MVSRGHERIRVGLLVPSSNTVMEVDFYRRLPEDTTLHTARMFMKDTTPEGESVMLDEYTMPAARALATALTHVVVFGCTSAGALRGNAYDRELCAKIGEETGAEVVSVIASVHEALDRRGGTRVGVITPYVDALNEKIQESVEASGDVKVAGIFGLGIDDNFAIASVEPTVIAAFAREKLAGLDIDLVFVSCTNFRAMDALPMLEQAFELPVVTSNLAAFEAVSRALERKRSETSEAATVAAR
jgi:maleate isomerase